LDLVDIGQRGFEGNAAIRKKGEALSVVFTTNHGTFSATSIQRKSFDFLRAAFRISVTDLPAEKRCDPTFCLHLVRTSAETFRIIRRRLLMT
jgi:hypothetical protein